MRLRFHLDSDGEKVHSDCGTRLEHYRLRRNHALLCVPCDLSVVLSSWGYERMLDEQVRAYNVRRLNPALSFE